MRQLPQPLSISYIEPTSILIPTIYNAFSKKLLNVLKAKEHIHTLNDASFSRLWVARNMLACLLPSFYMCASLLAGEVLRCGTEVGLKDSIFQCRVES